MLSSLWISSPVSYCVPARVATSASVAGWPQVALIEEMAVSTPSTPASMAFSSAISAIPVVAWQCRCRVTS
ncbi:Uncharacterised protein [Klebsiella pneumoniae]|nr:Uncharacterised protein [Klebsiella pneumoniae]